MSRVIKQTTKQKIAQIIDLVPDEQEKKLVQHAYTLAKKAHEGQKRASGDPYIIHPVSAALTLAEMQQDAVTIAATLLHDVVDDTPVTLKEIEKDFGKEIAFLVDGVSKLGKLKYRGQERHAENLRKMLVAMASDVRVILIKFADRLHNMETLDVLPTRKQHRIALETLEIYAPIATRLGISEIAKQLEDLAFPYIYPDQYKYIKTETHYRLPEAEKYLSKLHPLVLTQLQKENIEPIEIQTRAKHYYSLWRKLERNHYNWSQLNDLIAMRIIVNSIEECYATLGVLHKTWKPLLGQIKDYIALPKPSGYRGLHTTVFCVDGRQTEFQIRTLKMHNNAEYGIAAHWRYKNKAGLSDKSIEKTYAWVQKLQEWKKDNGPSEEFIDNLKIDVFQDRIFVFTPRGDVIDLPRGASPVDFAYAIHSKIGDSAMGAIVNGKMTALNSELANGDVVGILRSKNKTPSRTWLGYVKTSNARNNIRKWLRLQNRDENISIGLNILNEELRSLEGKTWPQLEKKKQQEVLTKFSYADTEELLVALGRGDVSVSRIIQSLITPQDIKKTQHAPSKSRSQAETRQVRIAGTSGIQMRIARCCNPSPPTAIASYVTIDRGASIHKINCRNLYRSTEKILPAYWSRIKGGQIVKVKIRVVDRIGMLQDVSRTIAGLDINIISLNTNTRIPEDKKNTQLAVEGGVDISADIEVQDLHQLKKMIEKLKSVDGIYEVRRI